MSMTKPLIVAYFDGDPEVRILSHFAHTPFELDGERFESVECFWVHLKTEDPKLRKLIAKIPDGLEVKRVGIQLKNEMRSFGATSMFSYHGQLYNVGSEAHHILIERANRAKVDQNPAVRDALIESGTRPLRHMLRNRYGQWRVGNSPALPAVVFDNMLMKIRTELFHNNFRPTLPLPDGIKTD